MPAAIRESMHHVIAQVAAELAATFTGRDGNAAGLTTVSLGGYTVVKLWDDHGLRFSVELDDGNWDTGHGAEHLDHARNAVHQAIKTVAERLLGVAEAESATSSR
jgi:hypothetical protein